jgi:hypothetical protein
MALTENKKLQQSTDGVRVKRSAPADSGTYYVGELLMVGVASNTVKPISGSTEPGTNVVGVVTKQQTVAQGETLEFEAGWFVLSGSGFTHAENGKLAWAIAPTTIYDAQSGATNAQLVGKFRGFTTPNNGSNNAVFEIGFITSGSTF